MDRNDEVVEQIRSFLTQDFALRKCIVEFDYNGKHYKIQFNASHTAEKIAVENPCVMMDFNYTNKETKDGHWLGEIAADANETPCFEPRLVTNARNKPGKRTTAADVLQVLKTKIALAFPVSIPVALIDGAGTNDWMKISPFHIMRGGDAFYEKYGYKSPELDDIKEALKRVRWSDCIEEQKEFIRQCSGVSDYPPEMHLIDIMKTISWEQENRWNNANEKVLSSRVLRLFATTRGHPIEMTSQGGMFDSEGRIRTIWTYTLNPEDPRWIRYNKELLFTAFHPIAEGGKRKKRKTRKLKRKSRAK